MKIRTMKITDYEKVYALWMSCKNMGFNDIDDSKEGIARFLERNPNTSFVAIERINAIQKLGFTKSENFLIGKTGYAYDSYWVIK